MKILQEKKESTRRHTRHVYVVFNSTAKWKLNRKTVEEKEVNYIAAEDDEDDDIDRWCE